MSNGKTVLVTGGAGFIGSNFIIYFLGKYHDYKIINYDLLTYAGNLNNLNSIENNENYFFIQGDICDSSLVDSVFVEYNPDFVVNFAAESHVDRSITDPQVFVKTNVLGTQVLLDVCKKHWLSDNNTLNNNKKFIQISTDEVYGSLGPDGYFSESTPLSPNSPYSASKASADMFVKAYYETYGLNVNITRCSNNYGPYQYPEKLIPLMISNAVEDKQLPVYGDGLNIRDWLYVEDHCRAIDMVTHCGRPGQIYNIGGHNEKKNIEIVKFILQELDKPQSLISYVKDRLGHDRRYAINADKIREELGWEPEVTFEEGIKETIQWYKENEQWLDKIKVKKADLL